VLSGRPRDETQLILQAAVAALAVLMTIIVAVVTLSWLSPPGVAPIGADRPVPVPPVAACCDVMP
jgi:hypothetical protein